MTKAVRQHGEWRDIVYWKTRKDAELPEGDIPDLRTLMTCIGMMDHRPISVTLWRPRA